MVGEAQGQGDQGPCRIGAAAHGKHRTAAQKQIAQAMHLKIGIDHTVPWRRAHAGAAHMVARVEEHGGVKVFGIGDQPAQPVGFEPVLERPVKVLDALDFPRMDAPVEPRQRIVETIGAIAEHNAAVGVGHLFTVVNDDEVALCDLTRFRRLK